MRLSSIKTKKVDLVEILDLALQLESCGESVYRYASQRLPQGPLRRMMEALAEQEVAHAGRFQELLGESVVEEMFRDPESEALSAFSDKVALSDLLTSDLLEIGWRIRQLTEKKEHALLSLEKVGSVSELIDFAIYLEESAVLLYEALLKYVSGPVAKTWVRSVLNEEKGHLEGFIGLKAQLEQVRIA